MYDSIELNKITIALHNKDQTYLGNILASLATRTPSADTKRFALSNKVFPRRLADVF